MSCPICLLPINDVDFCITSCKHKFHTSCLFQCKNECPLCREKLVEKPIPDTSKESLLTIKSYFENTLSEIFDDEDMYDIENHKNRLKKTDPNKYKLCYGNK